MKGSINVTPAELRRIANSVNDKVSRYESVYRRLYDEVRSMSSSWTGEANQRYTKQIEGFSGEFENLKKVLRGYEQFLLEAARIYAETASNIGDSASSLTTGR